MKKIAINRKMYERIKKMDHSQMNSFLLGCYENGYNDGVKAGKESVHFELDFDAVKAELMNNKGIGKVRADIIVRILKGLIR